MKSSNLLSDLTGVMLMLLSIPTKQGTLYLDPAYTL